MAHASLRAAEVLAGGIIPRETAFYTILDLRPFQSIKNFSANFLG